MTQLHAIVEGTRFEVELTEPETIPIRGRIVVRADVLQVAEAFAEVYKECLAEYVEAKNAESTERVTAALRGVLLTKEKLLTRLLKKSNQVEMGKTDLEGKIAEIKVAMDGVNDRMAIARRAAFDCRTIIDFPTNDISITRKRARK